jgi:VCBS repeat-containing protein
LACEPLEERTVLSVVLDGALLDLGINDDGSLITADQWFGGVGASFNGHEVLAVGASWALISVSADGVMYANTGPIPGSMMTLTVTDTSSGDTLSAAVVGTVTTDLELERTVSYDIDGSAVRFTVTLTNTGSATLENVAFTEGIDPDLDPTNPYQYRTYNDVVLDGQFARSHTIEVDSVTLTMGIGSADPRATASVELRAMDPFETINTPNDPEGAYADHHLHVAFDFGTLAPGDSVTAEYAMVVAASPEEADELFLGTLSPSNVPPVADDDSYAVDEDHTLTVAAPGVLLGDEDPDGDPLTAALEADPSHGTLTLNPNGSFTYTPDANFYGTDTFDYQVSDGRGGIDTATVTITVNPVIDAVIDVKPGNDNNRVKLKAAGVLPVAILSTSTADGEVEDFDAATLAALDMECFQFGDARAGYARVNPLRSTLEDVDGDGDLDLLLHFSMRDIVAAGALDADSVDVVLTAEYGARAVGVQLAGYDAVEMVLPKPKGKKNK